MTAHNMTSESSIRCHCPFKIYITSDLTISKTAPSDRLCHDICRKSVRLQGSNCQTYSIYRNTVSDLRTFQYFCCLHSAALTRKDTLGAGNIAESALRVGALLALPAGVGLAVLSGPIIQMLYPETNQEVASHCLLVLGIASAFVCMMLLCNAILQANGRAALPIWFIAIGSAIKLGVNFLLVQLPSVGIKGAPMGTLVCFALVSVMELVAIKRVTPHPPKYLRVFVKPALAAALMGAAVWAGYGLLHRFLGNTMAVAGSIVLGGLVYGVLVLVLRIVSRDDLSLMPKGDKIAKLLHIR